MKKILGLVTMLVAIGCSLYSNETNKTYDSYFAELAGGHEIYFGTDEQYNEWMALTSMAEVSTWIRSNIEYRLDEEEEFSNPEVTLKRGYGDCDDFALLSMNIIYVNRGLKMNLILLNSFIQNNEKVIVDGGNDVNHATIGYNDLVYYLYFLQYAYKEPVVGYSYSFDYVFPNAPDNYEAYSKAL